MITLLIAFSLLLQPPTPPIGGSGGGSDSGDWGEYIEEAETLQDNETLSAGDNQIFTETGAPLLPALNSPEIITTLGYMKFVLDSQFSQQVFGVFAPIVQHVRIAFALVIAWLTFYGLQQLISILIRLVLFVIRFLVPFFG